MSPTGTSWRPWPDEHRAALRKWHGEGLSGGQISRKFAASGVTYSRNAVVGMWCRMGLPSRGRASNSGGWKGGVRKRAERPFAGPRMKAKPKNRGTNGALASKVLHAIKHPPKLAPLPVDLGPPEALMITTLQLTPHSCKWPLGEAVGAQQLYCGAPKEIEVSYCVHHQRIAYRPLAPRSERDAARLAERLAA